MYNVEQIEKLLTRVSELGLQVPASFMSTPIEALCTICNGVGS